MIENMFFLDNEHVGMGGMLPPKKVICLLMLYAWFPKTILLGIQPKSTNEISHNSKDSISSKFYVAVLGSENVRCCMAICLWP